MAKSILHAVVGILVKESRLALDEPAAFPEWQKGDPRAAITLNQLLHMTSGLRFCEDYVNDDISDSTRMLYTPGADDMGLYAADLPADHPPDTVFNYSSGTSNIISRIVRDIVGSNDEYRAFISRELFDRIGITSATLRFDRSGTWIASTFCDCTPRDFARFGLLYLRDGVWDHERILPEGWVDHARTQGPVHPADERGYGAHWWLVQDDLGSFYASGYIGQILMLVPALDLIIVRNGETAMERVPFVRQALQQVIDLFR
jgi:CubicO group peptidase (beta-lactamase class C family)